MLKELIALFLFSSLAVADGFIFNGYGGNETQIGNLKADTVYNGSTVKASLTDGQPISRNGSYGTNEGQIGYLSLIPSSEEYPCHTINASETWTSDRYQCQNITTSNIAVDCNGHTIWLNSSSSTGIHGIRIGHAIYNFTIKNCVIDGGQAGIIAIDSWVAGTGDSKIYNNTIQNTYKTGVTGIATYGMYLWADGSGWSFKGDIANNTLYNITANCTGVGCSASAYGVYGSAVVSSNFTNNNFNIITGNSSGYGWYGIIDAGSTGIQYTTFRNNSYSNIKSIDIVLPKNYGAYNKLYGNTYTNSKQAIYMGDMYFARVENETIYGTGYTNVGIEIASSVMCFGNAYLQNITIMNVQNGSASTCLLEDTPDTTLAWQACSYQNITLINCSRAFSISGQNNTYMADSNIINSSVYDFVSSSAYNTIFLNTTFNKSKTLLALSNLTVKWYARVNVTNESGIGEPAYVNVSDNISRQEFQGQAGSNGLTSWFIVNDTVLGTGAINFTHSINATYGSYLLSTADFNFTGRDWTYNITLSLPVIPPGGGGGGYVPRCIDGTPYDTCSNVSRGYFCNNGLLLNDSRCAIIAPPFPEYTIPGLIAIAQSWTPAPVKALLEYVWTGAGYWVGIGILFINTYFPWLGIAIGILWGLLRWLFWTTTSTVWDIVKWFPNWLWWLLLVAFIILAIIYGERRRQKGNRRESAKG